MKYEDEYQELKDLVDALGAATGDVDFEGIVDRRRRSWASTRRTSPWPATSRST